MAWVESKWVSWTPTVTQSGSVTITITQAVYHIIGDVCFVNCSLVITGTGTAGNAIVIAGQPAAMQASANQTNIGTLYIGGTNYMCVLYRQGATDWRGVNDAAGGFVGAAPSFGLTSAHSLHINGVYRVA